jgi:6,7-dimethyl-8-ribityllumazine synthase
VTSKPHVLIVEARFYADIADELVKGAIQTLDEAGATHERASVPGAFEIPGAIAMTIEAQRISPPHRSFDGFLALGCVIRGETTHYDYVCSESARALILTVENDDQAWARAGIGEKNKGGDAARACLAMIDLRRRLGLRAR